MYHLDFCSPYIFWTSAAHVSCGLLQPHVSCGLLQPMSHLDFCSPCIFWTSAAHASFGFLLDLRRLLHECVFQNGFQKPSENSIKNQPKRHQKPSETGRRKSWKQPKGVGNFKRFSYFQANGFLGFRTNRSSIFFNRRMPWVDLHVYEDDTANATGNSLSGCSFGTSTISAGIRAVTSQWFLLPRVKERRGVFCIPSLQILVASHVKMHANASSILAPTRVCAHCTQPAV